MPSLFSTLFRRADKRRTYTDLLGLDDHLLRDIGLSRGDLTNLLYARRVNTRTTAHE